MYGDRQTQAHVPRKATLASTRNAKNPLTPRLAATATSTLTPTSRRSDRADDTTESRPPSEDVATPVQALANSNITPRSSARKSRGGSSAHSTPTGTPKLSFAPLHSGLAESVSSDGQGTARDGLGIKGFNERTTSSRPSSTLGITPHVANAGYGSIRTDPGADTGRSTFFHADDAAKSRPQPVPQKKAPTFFYANGDQDQSTPDLGAPSPPLSSVSRGRAENQFFHASDAQDRKSIVSSHSPSVNPPPTLVQPVESILFSQTANRPAPMRSLSPGKSNIHLSYRKGASQVIRPGDHKPPILPKAGLESDQRRTNSSRRSSVASATAASRGHAKTASVSSIDSDRPARIKIPDRHEKPLISAANAAVASPTQFTPDAAPASQAQPVEVSETVQSPVLMASTPQSPVKGEAGGSKLQQLNELAANARRERKVLDLEISNSSLLAINRSLEREVRKQKAELRRFRRLSRAGRLSMASNRLASAESTDVDHSFEVGTDEEDHDLEDEDESDLLSDDSVDESALSPEELAIRDSRHRAKDEKILQLDLAKHRELLVDSQKMNQSLKRCLGWTEDLIAEGKKALQYQVRVSDVKLGGRVLESEDQFDDEDTISPSRGGNLLSPWNENGPLRLSLDSEGTDKDSGVELDVPRSYFSDAPVSRPPIWHDLSSS